MGMKLAITIFLSVILLSGLLIIGEEQGQHHIYYTGLYSSSLRSHAPIVIDGNDDFADQAAAEDWTGSGTHSDPYVIDGYEIEVVTNYSAGIAIVNVDIHFTVSNCRITSTASFVSGMYLVTVSNGTIANNTITISDGHGILIINSAGNCIRDNTLTDCHLHCALHLVESPDNTVASNIFINNLRGISLYKFSNNNTIQGNLFINSSQYGIYLFNRADNNLITQNEITGNEIGIRIYFAANSTITRNKIAENGEGINITVNSYFNVIYLNSFIDNGAIQASSDNVTNLFSNGTIGNYWSDYNGTDLDKNGVGDTAHPIAGKAGARDPYPVTVPEHNDPDLSNPEDLSIVEGTTGNAITWTAGDEHPWVCAIHKNGSIYIEDMPWTNGSIVISIDGLSTGTYQFEITVYDRFGNVRTDTVVVRVSASILRSLLGVLPWLAALAVVSLAGMVGIAILVRLLSGIYRKETR